MSLLLQLLAVFLKIGLLSIGGGYNMIPLMQAELLTAEWLTTEQFVDILAISEATPGPIAVNAATFVGWTVAGIPGAAVATIGVCLPGLMLVLAFGVLLLRWRERLFFQTMMFHIRPALVGLLLATVLLLAPDIFHLAADAPDFLHTLDWRAILLFAGGLAVTLWKKPHPLTLIVCGAILGPIVYM